MLTGKLENAPCEFRSGVFEIRKYPEIPTHRRLPRHLTTVLRNLGTRISYRACVITRSSNCSSGTNVGALKSGRRWLREQRLGVNMKCRLACSTDYSGGLDILGYVEQYGTVSCSTKVGDMSYRSAFGMHTRTYDDTD